MGDFLFLLRMPSDICKSVMECITNVVVSLCDSPTDIASCSMSATIMAVISTTDGAVGSRMMTDARCSVNFLNAEASSKRSAEVPIVHWRSALFRDEVSTRFRARPKGDVDGVWDCETAMEGLKCLGIDLC